MYGFVSTGVVARQLRSGAAVSSTRGVARAPAPMRMSVFEKAMADFKSDFPQFAKKGWGVTAKAERWNGRHAMAGWLIIWATAYMKGHGMLPDGILDPAQWGSLTNLGGYTPISKERAVILIAHVHLLLVSVAATMAPFSFQDKLLLDDGEADEKPAGLIPAFKMGLCKEAELWNGRLAGLGIIVIVMASFATGESVLDLTNKMFGGVFF